jgi:hypothetical protein
VHLEASTKPHVHWKFENFGTNIASIMACLNFKNGPKTALRLLGVKESGQLGWIPMTTHQWTKKLFWCKLCSKPCWKAYSEGNGYDYLIWCFSCSSKGTGGDTKATLKTVFSVMDTKCQLQY